jgi:acetoin utilization protein AcuB
VRVRERMRRDALTISPTTSLAEARRLMMGPERCGLLAVVEAGRLVGVVGDTDLADAWPSPATTLTRGESAFRLGTIPVSRVMRRDPLTIAPATLLAEAVRLLRDHDLAALPVVERDRLAGVLRAADVIGTLATRHL